MRKGDNKMKEEYDFTNAIKNPYVKRGKKPITINIDVATLTYFRELSVKANIPYQTLINMYLTDCANRKVEPKTTWA